VITLLEEIGGPDVIDEVVAGFYERTLNDDRLVAFFRGVSMTRLQGRQVDFLCSILGGTNLGQGHRDLREAHAGMHIGHAHFDAVLGHLTAALEAAGIAPPLVARVLAEIEPYRADSVEQ
jgi:hemoglobin